MPKVNAKGQPVNTGSGGNPASGIGAPANSPTAAHQLFVSIAGEVIGVLVLAIVADMNEDLGSVAVAIMAGWFLLFLMKNAVEIAPILQKA